MSNQDVPADFTAHYSKTYGDLGWTIELNPRGITHDPVERNRVWWYRLTGAEGTLLTKGEFKWHADWRHLSDEQIADYLFMTHANMETSLKNITDSTTPLAMKEEFAWMLYDGSPEQKAIYIVWHDYYSEEPNQLTFDSLIVRWLQVESANRWTAILSTDGIDDRLYEVSSNEESSPHCTVRVFVQHETYVDNISY